MRTNALLVLCPQGWRERIDYPAISDTCRIEAHLALGSTQSGAEADRIADRQLELFSTERTEIVVGVEPVSLADCPYKGFTVGDYVTIDAASERVVGMGVNEDSNGRLTFAPILRDTLAYEDERFALTLKKMANGTLGGESIVASPASLVDVAPNAPDCCPPAPPPHA